MRKLNFYFIIILAAALSACGYSEEFNEFNHENTFLISFPDYMKECDDFQADLELKNSYRNTYGFVKVYEKEGRTLEEFQHQMLGVLKGYELLNDVLVTDSVYRDTEDFQSIDIELYGLMQDENIYYWHSCFESAGKFYEVVCWTRSMDRKQRYGPDLEKVIMSFKPLV